MNVKYWWKWFKREIEYLFTKKKYKVELSDEAKKQLGEMEPDFIKAFDKVIKELEKNPFLAKK